MLPRRAPGARVDPVQRVAEAERPQGVVAELEPADGARRVGHDEPAAAGGVEPHRADPGDRPDVVTRRPDVAHPERPPSGVRTGVRATTRFVSGSIRWIRGSSSTEAQS